MCLLQDTFRWKLAQLCLREERVLFASDSLSRGIRGKAVSYVAAGDCLGANGAPRSDRQLFCYISTEIDTEPLQDTFPALEWGHKPWTLLVMGLLVPEAIPALWA
jgi:hypothetical protein